MFCYEQPTYDELEEVVSFLKRGLETREICEEKLKKNITKLEKELEARKLYEEKLQEVNEYLRERVSELKVEVHKLEKNERRIGFMLQHKTKELEQLKNKKPTIEEAVAATIEKVLEERGINF